MTMKQTCAGLAILSLFAGVPGLRAEENRLGYLGPDQAYDKLPGTLVTPHVPWLNPLPGGKLKVFFITTNGGAREVVELGQRLAMDRTVLMTARRNSFYETDFSGQQAVPQYAKLVEKLAQERLHPSIGYDVIIDAKIPWKVLPDFVRAAMLEKVKNGAGLVYIEGLGGDTTWLKDFGVEETPATGNAILQSLPLTAMALVPIKDAAEGLAELKKLKGADWHTQDGWRAGGWWTVGMAPVTIRTFQLEKGRIAVIDFWEGGNRGEGFPLTPLTAEVNETGYDLLFGLLAKTVLWASGRTAEVTVVPLTPDNMVVDRSALKTTALAFSIIPVADRKLPYDAVTTIRDSTGKVLERKELHFDKVSEKQELKVSLPILPDGDYLVDVMLKEATGAALDFCSRAFTVQARRELSVTTKKDRYRPDEIVEGEVVLSEPLKAGESLLLAVTDTWQREVARQTLQPGTSTKAAFSFPVKSPLSSLWDIHARIADSSGAVLEKTCTIGIPNYAVDNYYLSTFYGITNDVRTRLAIKYSWPLYGINGGYTRNAIWGGLYTPKQAKLAGVSSDAEQAVRSNLRIVTSVFPNGLAGSGGNFGTVPGPNGPIDKNCLTNTDAATETQLKDWKEWVDQDGKLSSRFGTMSNFICAENFLGLNGCYSPTCIAAFQKYVEGMYGTIARLNDEYGTAYMSFAEVIPIPEPAVFEKNLIPMWLDFRMFMFTEYTDAYRRAARRLGEYHDVVRANTVDMWFVQPNYGFSPFDWPEMFKDVDSYATEIHNFAQWEALMYEIAGSLSADKGFQIVRLDPYWFWETEHWKVKVHPWWTLFHGGQMSIFHYWGTPTGTAGGNFVVTADWSQPLEWFKILSDNIKEMQQGIAPLLVQSKRLRDPAMIVLSSVNVAASVLDPVSEMNYDNNHRDFFVALQSIGITPEFIGERDVTAQALKKAGCRLLVLPYNRAMSDALAATLREFVAAGGMLLADDQPGILDEHCKPRTASVVADLFPSFGKKFYSRTVGKGTVVYTGGELMGMEGKINTRDFGILQGLQESVATSAGIVPRVKLMDRFGVERRDIFRSWFAHAGTQYLCLLRESNIKDDETGPATTVLLTKKVHVYEMRSGTYLGYTDKVPLSIPMYEARILALYPTSVSSLEVKPVAATVKPGQDLVYRLVVSSASGANQKKTGQAVHVTVTGPDGQPLPGFTKNCLFQGESWSGTMPVALNAAPGRYTINAVSIATGHKTSAAFDVQATP